MSAPPLPEIFGNYALENFAEIVPPEGVSWLPQTAGWLWLGVAVLALALHYLWRALKKWYRNRYRREAIARLQALANTSQPGELAGDINRILKITAMVAYSRESVAKLSGEIWVDFLNRQCPLPPFNPEQLEHLARSAYRSNETNPPPQQLLQASVRWVEQHGVTAPDGVSHV